MGSNPTFPMVFLKVAKEPNTLKRLHVCYSGRVQGVGFRFTAETTAMALRLTGWVRNLRDGRVEIVVEGDEPVLHEFLEHLRTGPMANFIRKTDVKWEAATSEFGDFEIRYF